MKSMFQMPQTPEEKTDAVEQALYEKALGATQVTESIEYTYNSRTKNWEPKRKTEITQEQTPDTKAALAWMAAYRPERWNDHQEPVSDLKVEVEILGQGESEVQE